MNVLYYYYFLFYQKVLKEETPHLFTILALSASQAFFLIYCIDTANVLMFCELFFSRSESYLFCIAACIVLNYFVFYNSGLAAEIVKSKPKFFKSNEISLSITLVFFLITTSFMFWVTYVLMVYLENC